MRDRVAIIRKRSASDSRSVSTPSSRTRAAASSIASGMPSSCRQIAAIVPALPSVRVKRRSPALARDNEQLHGRAVLQRLEAVDLLAVDAERHLAGDDEADGGRPGTDVRCQPAGGVDQMLRIVQNDQQLALGNGSEQRR